MDPQPTNESRDDACAFCLEQFTEGDRIGVDYETGQRFCSMQCWAFELGLSGAEYLPGPKRKK